MPFVHVQTVKGLLSDAQKRELQDRITDLMVEIEGRGDSSNVCAQVGQAF